MSRLKHKIKPLRMFGIFMTLITAVTCMLGSNGLNTVFAENGTKYSVTITGDGAGRATIAYNDEEHTITDGDYVCSLEEGTEVKLTLDADSTIASVKRNGEEITGIPEGTSSYDKKDVVASEEINYEVTFNKADDKTKEDSNVAKSEPVDEEIPEEEEVDASDVIDTDVNLDETDYEYKRTKEFNKSEMTLDTSKQVVLKYMYAIPGAVTPEDTLTSALIDKDPKTTIYTQMQEQASVYKAEDGTYKILADTPFKNGLAIADAYDWDCARGNDFAEMITEGVTYDKETKIITIQPDVFKEIKKEQKADENESKDFSQLQFQFLIPVNVQDDLQIKATVEDGNGLIKPAFGKTVALRPFMTSRFQLATNDTKANISKSNISVYLNDSETPLDADEIAYDKDAGQLGLAVYGSSIYSMKIKITPTKKSLFRKASANTGVAMGNTTVDQLGVLAYLRANTKDVFKVGSAINVTGKFGNNGYPAAPINGSPANIWNQSRVGAPYFKNVDWIVGDGGESAYTESGLGTPTSITMNGSTIDFTYRNTDGSAMAGNWVGGGNGGAGADPTTFNGAIQAFCHHIKQSVGTISQSDARAIRFPSCTLRVLDKRTINGYVHVVFGFETNLHMFGGATPQTVGTVFELAFKKDTKAYLSIEKKSSNESISSNNALYTFEGCTYGLYKDTAFKNRVAVLTLDRNGQSNRVAVDPGTYYLQEISAPKGYSLSKGYYTLKVALGDNKRFINIMEAPQYVLSPRLIHKTDAVMGTDLSNVVYEVKMYKGLNISNISELNGKTASATWKFKTDPNGYISVSSEYLYGSGNSPLYKNDKGSAILPAGVVTMREIQAASANYSVDNTTYFANINTNTTGKEQITMTTQELTNTPTNTKSYGIYIQKAAQSKGKNQPLISPMDQGRITNTVFLHTLPNGSTEKITYDPQFRNYPIDQIPTWAYYTEITNLPVGVHKIKELTPGQNVYQINPTEVNFRVNSDRSIDILSGVSDSENVVSLTKMTDTHNATGVTTKTNVYCKLITVCDLAKGFKYRITKKDTNGDPIKGVQFSLYSKDDCSEDSLITVMTTDAKGECSVSGLQPNVDYYVKETSVPDGYILPTDHAKYKKQTGYDSKWNPIYTTVTATWDAMFHGYLNAGLYGGGQGYIDKYENIEHTIYNLGQTINGKTYNTLGNGSFSGSFANNNLEIHTDFVNERVGPKALYIRKVAKSSVQVEDEQNAPHGTGTYISNTQFTHTKPNGSTETITYTPGGTGNTMLNKEGFYKITPLDVGIHTLKEKKAGNNIYSLNNTVIKFEVKKNGIIEMISGFDDNSGVSYIKTANDNSGMILITEEDSLADTNLRIIKKDFKSKKVLSGAVFTLYSDSECKTKIDEQTTGTDGAVNFKKLKEGKMYFFKETKAPHGYTYNLDEFGNNKVYSFIVKKTVSSGMTIGISNDLVWNNTAATLLGKNYEISKTQTTSSTGSVEDNIQISITNQPPFYSGASSLPKTGSTWTPLLVAGGLTIGLIAIICKKRKE